MTPPRPEEQTHKFLSDALVARGFVTQKAMDAALQASRSGRRYSDILVANGDVSDDDLARTLADHYRIDHVDLDAFPIDADVAHLMSPDAARRLGALPLALLPTGEVVVAVHDPESMANMAEIAKRIGREIRAVVASRSQVERHIDGLAATRDGSAGLTAAVPAAPAPTAAAPIAPAPVVPVPAPALVPAPVPAAPVATPPAAAAPPPAADHSHIDEERSLIAERARALAQYRDEMPSVAVDPSPAWASAPGSEPQARAVGHVTIPPDPQRQAEVAGSEGPATTVRELDRRLADAERRAREAEAQARVAEDRADAAEKHADGMSAAATAANEALAQLAQARLIADQTARASAREIESLSNELDSERAERRRLESELQRRLWQDRSNDETPRPQAPAMVPASAPGPGPAPTPAPAPAPTPTPAAAAQPIAIAPAAAAVEAAPAQPASRPLAAQPVAAQPAPAPQPVAAQPAAATQPVAAPFAPVQPVAERRVATHEADSTKVRGLRRMIAALRR